MKRVLLVLAGLGLTACAVTLAGDAPRPGGPATVVGAFPWESDLPAFGGFSAIEVGADGASLLLVSDRTAMLRGRIARDARGAVAGVEATAPVGLLGEDGARLAGLRADSEGLAVDASGAIFVSFEGRPAVRRLGAPGQPSTLLPAAPAWADLPLNASIEALAVDGSGALYAIPETAGEDGAFPVWRLPPGGAAWEVAFRLPRRDGFAVTGADIGPDGRLVVVERDFTGWAFRSRLRRVYLDGSGEETLWTTKAGDFDNLESVSVWRDDRGAYGGGLRATLVSDDNFRFFQQTELVDLRLPD